MPNQVQDAPIIEQVKKCIAKTRQRGQADPVALAGRTLDGIRELDAIRCAAPAGTVWARFPCSPITVSYYVRELRAAILAHLRVILGGFKPVALDAFRASVEPAPDSQPAVTPLATVDVLARPARQLAPPCATVHVFCREAAPT